MDKKTRLKYARELRKIVDQKVKKQEDDFDGFTRCLCGLCAICSIALRNILNKNGDDAKVMLGYFRDEGMHCWVEVGDMVIDITATQFHNITKKVFTLRRGTKKYFSMYKNGEPIGLNFRKFKGWPPDQKPNKRKIDKLVKEVIC
jgi:hypothetical protein